MTDIDISPIKIPYENCYGCFACKNICPTEAITISDNETGFFRPVIDEKKCLKCNRCYNLCTTIHSNDLLYPIYTYAGRSQNEKTIMNSSSGGVFTELANWILDNSGIVYGCSYGNKKISHISIRKKRDLYLLQGSKYVQSYLGDCFKEIETNLKNNHYVLFSGTPCQVNSLRVFLKRDYDKLFLVDLFCHGVPSQAMFWDYISYLERKYKDNIRVFEFRGKYLGWSESFRILFNKHYEIKGPALRSSFYRLFLDSSINNESCTNCRFKSVFRSGDVSIGDCWGINDTHGIAFHEGASSIFVNSSKGKFLIDELLLNKKIFLKEQDIQFFVRNNSGALEEQDKSINYDNYVSLWMENGYKSIEKKYQQKYKYRILRNIIAGFFPKKVRKIVNRIKL